MAVTREQAVLEILLDISDTLKGFDKLQSQYAAAIQKLNVATDKADIDQLTREAKEARDAMERLAQQGQKQLRKLADAGKLATTEYKELRRDVDLLEKEISQADRELAQFTQRQRGVKDLTDGVGRMRAAWVAAAAALIGFALALRRVGGLLQSITEATDKQTRAQAQVRAAIESTGGAAGVTAEELGEMARDLRSVTTISDESILSLQSLLLTFTNLRKEELPEITERVLDLATSLAEASGGTLELRSAALQIAKALNDPIRGVSALAEAGIQFTDQQRDQIKVLIESNRLYDAQRIILDELNTQFGGRARAAADSLGGAVAQLRNSFNDLLEVVGEQGLNKELTILARLLSQNAEQGGALAETIGRGLASAVARIGDFIAFAFEARGAVSAMVASVLRSMHAMSVGIFRTMDLIERGIAGAIQGIASLIPDADLPGTLDDSLRQMRDRVLAGLGNVRKAAQDKRVEIAQELRKLSLDFSEAVLIDKTNAAEVRAQLERIRKEIEAAAASAGALGGGLDTAGEALEEFRNQLFGNADALRANSERIVELVQSLGGLGGATATQREVIEAEVGKLIKDFDRIGEAPPAALAALARAMGITGDAIVEKADAAAASLRGLVDAAEEVSRIPAATFRADLDLDEGDIAARLAEVQGRLEEMRSGLTIDPVEETALLAEESQLLTDLSRAQNAWQEAIVDTNRAQGDQVGLSEEHVRLLRDQGLLTQELAEGLGLTAEQFDNANERFRLAGDELGGVVESGNEAAQVTLPALDQGLLDSAKSSGELDSSLEAMADRLLVTAGNAEVMGKGLADAGAKGAEGQKKAAAETKSAAETVKEHADQVRSLTTALRELGEVQSKILPAGVPLWQAYTSEIKAATAACGELRACQGGG